MSAGKTYKIESLHDFTAVPDDRLMACLEAFADWVDMCRLITHGEAPHPALKLGFTWCDDGKRDITFSCTVPEMVRADIEEAPQGMCP